MAALLGLLQFFLSPIGRWIGVGVLIGAAYLAGDVRGRRIEYAKCEEAAKAAQQAADAQDLQAALDANADASKVVEQLKKQKETADAQIAELKNRLTTVSVPVGAPCLYGDSDLPDSKPVAPAGRVRDNVGKGTGHPRYPWSSRVPAADPKAPVPEGK
jgi:hypothetical protein